jgi:hypothetical protein
MTKPKNTDKRMVKNDASFHDDESNDKILHHHKAPTSAATPATADAHEDPRVSLSRESTDELRQRASGLVIPGWRNMSREELIASLEAVSLDTRRDTGRMPDVERPSSPGT